MATVIPADDLQAARAAGASESDLSLVAQLKAKAAEFERYRQELVAAGPAIARTNDYDLMVEYGELLERADSIKSKIQAATSAIDNAFRWAKDQLGLSGGQLRALGYVWLIPAAVIAAALAVIGYWINDYLKFRQRYVEQTRIAQELVGAGMEPGEAQRQAAQAVAATVPSLFNLGGGFGKVALIGGLGVLAWFVFFRK